MASPFTRSASAKESTIFAPSTPMKPPAPSPAPLENKFERHHRESGSSRYWRAAGHRPRAPARLLRGEFHPRRHHRGDDRLHGRDHRRHGRVEDQIPPHL